jgi:hypothetical protein
LSSIRIEIKVHTSSFVLLRLSSKAITKVLTQVFTTVVREPNV